MIRLEDTTELQAPVLPPENPLSRRYLRMIEKWIPVGVEYFSTWPDRPNCGHFFGGCHWYGNETNAPAKAFALASLSPEYNEKATGVSRERLREMAIQGIRYLCFTHDSGPEECVRPATGMGRPETCGNKWGERGKGFFRESQCGHGIAAMALVCLLLREHLDEETWMLMARVAGDYAARFGDMPPKSGVYWDTQMEENAWTSHGLTSCFLFLSRHERAAAWEATARRWMYSTCATPQDAYDQAQIGDTTASKLTARTYTTLPDYWAENHGMVHPGYTTSGVRSLMSCGCLLKLWGRDLPSELFWNRRRVYESLKALTDGAGYAQAMQGMDWHYLPTVGSETPHAIASVFFDDPDAAALQVRALRNGELRQEGNGGAMYDREFSRKAHDQQDPMIMRESTILGVASLYLFHRLMGAGAKPTSEKELEKRLAGVRHYPHAGFVHHRHGKGQTSFAWRNSVMAMPLTREGIYTIAPCSDSFLARPRVKDRPDSHRLQSIRISEYDAGFALAMVMDRCQESLRQEVLFASLPDGRALSLERLVALEDLTLESLDQGFLRITNETFPLLGDNCRGARVLYHPDGAKEYRGWLGDAESQDIIDSYNSPVWLNIDNRMGLRFVGTGRAVYHNRHYLRPYRAIADDLTLSRMDGSRAVTAGQEAARLAVLICPEQPHRKTASSILLEPKSPPDAVSLYTEGYLAAANFRVSRRTCAFDMARQDEIPVYAGGTVEARKERLRIAVPLEGRSAALFQAIQTLTVKGDVLVETTTDGTAFVTNPGKGKLSVKIAAGKGKGGTRQIAAGQTRKL